MKIKAWALLLKTYQKVIRKLRLFCIAFFFRAFVNYSLHQHSGQAISQLLPRDFCLENVEKFKFKGWKRWTHCGFQGKTIQKCLDIKGRNLKEKHMKIIQVQPNDMIGGSD